MSGICERCKRESESVVDGLCLQCDEYRRPQIEGGAPADD